MKRLENYVLLLLGFVLTLILTLVSDFLLNLSKETTFLIFAFGSTITITATLLEREIKSDVEDILVAALEVYELLGHIEDQELRILALDVLEKARVELSELRQGIIHRPAELELPTHDRLKKARKLIRTVAVVESTFLSERIETTSPRNARWYQSLHRAIERGVDVEEILILKKNMDLESESVSFCDLGPLQDTRGRKYVAHWQDVANAGGGDLLYNFTLIDEREVQYQRLIPGGGYETIIEKAPTTVREFLRKYRAVQKVSHEIRETLMTK